jgi:hypothetical protein
LYGSSSTTAISSASNVQTELKPNFQIVNTYYMVTNDIVVIRLQDIFDSMKNLPVMKRLDSTIRIFVNTGSVASMVSQGGIMLTSGSTNTFVNTCPIIQSCLGNIPSTAIGLVSGLFISKPGATNLFGGVNLANASSGNNPLTTCRIYFRQIKLHPERALEYFSKNKSKRVCYTSFYSNQASAITSGSTYNQLIQSGVRHIRGVLIVPFISSTTNGIINTAVATGVTSFAQYQSPFDSAPLTTSPISLINLNVYIGNQAVLKTAFNTYTFENFLEQVALFDKINNSDLGLSCGLISQQWWESSRYYYIDCSRGDPADQMCSRNVNVTFLNNSLQTIDCLIYTLYYDSLIVDAETGLMQKE